MDFENYFNIRYTSLQVTLCFHTSGNLPRYKSSAIRGGLGDYLLEMNCICPSLRLSEKCKECGFISSCIAQNIMYAPLKHRPPYVTEESIGFTISCTNFEEYFEKGSELEFSLVLFGDTISYLNPILQAFYALGASTGLGKNHLTFEVKNVKNRYGENILSNGQIFLQAYQIDYLSDTIKQRMRKGTKEGLLKFYTPVTLKYNGEFQKKFTGQAVLNAITRRVYLFNCMEGNIVPEIRFLVQEKFVACQSAKMISVPRYSGRKNQRMVLQGIKGYLRFDSLFFACQQLDRQNETKRNWSDIQANEEITPFLIAGEILGIGKNTKFGFGKYYFY